MRDFYFSENFWGLVQIFVTPEKNFVLIHCVPQRTIVQSKLVLNSTFFNLQRNLETLEGWMEGERTCDFQIFFWMVVIYDLLKIYQVTQALTIQKLYKKFCQMDNSRIVRLVR
eukprot:TRINITY_DN17425_c1_g1_i1.p8 TRINITY_DN17425_c1_g1~~TRINITY_DN17425_c1_g1_i1.p8  ORF type:complete len:113 (-),score=8.59 TRINITY_DN17425_c1_g1_i1:514-852(-)